MPLTLGTISHNTGDIVVHCGDGYCGAFSAIVVVVCGTSTLAIEGAQTVVRMGEGERERDIDTSSNLLLDKSILMGLYYCDK